MRFFILFVFAFLGQQLYAQKKIMVHVEDSLTHEPLIGASVYWAGTTDGSAIMPDGMTYLDAPRSYPAKLVASYVGYKPDTLELTKFEAHIHMYLSEDIILDVTEVKGRRKDQYVRILDPAKTEVISQN